MDALLTKWHGNIPLFFPISATVSASKETIREKEQKNKLLTSRETHIKISFKNLTIDTRHSHKRLQKTAEEVEKPAQD